MTKPKDVAKKTNIMGPPTKWSPELEMKCLEYIDGGFRVKVKPTDFTEVVPTVSGLAWRVKVSRETLYAWEKDKDTNISDILSLLKMWQECGLVNNGLTGEYNALMSKLILTHHGYTDKTQIGEDKDAPLSDLGAVERAAGIAAILLRGEKAAQEAEENGEAG